MRQYERPQELTWWTFAGGRINTTIKFILREIYGWKVTSDNLKLRLEGDGLLDGGFEGALEDMSERAFWRDSLPWDDIIAALPEYRLSKFQQVLPMPAQRELVGSSYWIWGVRRGFVWVKPNDKSLHQYRL